MRQKILLAILIITIAGAFVFLRASSNGVKLRDVSVDNLLAKVNTTNSSSSKYQTCKCPYRVVSVGGTGSKDTDPNHPEENPAKGFHDFVSSAAGGSTSRVNLNDNDTRIPDVERAVKGEIEKELKKEPLRKVLVIAHSLGGPITQSQLGDLGPCVDMMAVDPPVNHKSCKWDPLGIFNDTCKVIKNTKKDIGNDADTTDWTNGTAEPGEVHTPFGNPGGDNGKNKKRLDDLQKKIQDKLKSCSNN